MKTNIKMEVNPQKSQRIQEICFENNVLWYSNGENISNVDARFLHLAGCSLSYSNDTECFKNDESEEVDAGLFIRTNGSCEEVFYDCNLPDEKEGHKLIELSDDIYKYEKIVKITRVEVIGKNGREFVSLLEDGHYEFSLQDNGKTIKIFEK